jgi:acetyl esterase
MSPTPSGRQPGLAVPRVADVQLRGPAGPLPARAYWPVASGPHVAPALLVLFPGDGEAPDVLERADALCRGVCSYVGVVVLSVTYRSATPWFDGAALEDATAAVHWAADHAAQLDADPGRLMVAGTGVGGDIAAAVALRASDDGWPAIERQVLIRPELVGVAADERHERTADRLLRSLARSVRPALEA